jgi:hypothetical protein
VAFLVYFLTAIISALPVLVTLRGNLGRIGIRLAMRFSSRVLSARIGRFRQHVSLACCRSHCCRRCRGHLVVFVSGDRLRPLRTANRPAPHGTSGVMDAVPTSSSSLRCAAGSLNSGTAGAESYALIVRPSCHVSCRIARTGRGYAGLYPASRQLGEVAY